MDHMDEDRRRIADMLPFFTVEEKQALLTMMKLMLLSSVSTPVVTNRSDLITFTTKKTEQDNSVI